MARRSETNQKFLAMETLYLVLFLKTFNILWSARARLPKSFEIFLERL